MTHAPRKFHCDFVDHTGRINNVLLVDEPALGLLGVSAVGMKTLSKSDLSALVAKRMWKRYVIRIEVMCPSASIS